jgi:hypothetical protein
MCKEEEVAEQFMRIIRSRNPIRRDWSKHPSSKDMLLDCDLSIVGSKLKAKLVVFKTRKGLRAFWRAFSTYELGRSAMGAVSQLSCEVILSHKGRERRFTEVDPRYFCVIGLVKEFLSMEIICHEATHAGIAFAKRAKRTAWDHRIDEFDEESICYPTGMLAAEINRAIYGAGLHE